jgi:hypothetical protein
MKNRWIMFLMLIVMLLVLSPGLMSGSGRLAADDEPLPCDPGPTHWCYARGGTFNYVTCRCEFPQ